MIAAPPPPSQLPEDALSAKPTMKPALPPERKISPGSTLTSKTRGFCPSCHAKRLEEWSEWMRETLLLNVPHRQVDRWSVRNAAVR